MWTTLESRDNTLFSITNPETVSFMARVEGEYLEIHHLLASFISIEFSFMDTWQAVRA